MSSSHSRGANAQQSAMQVSLTYSYSCTVPADCTDYRVIESFSGTASLKPATQGIGFEGVGVGNYQYTNDIGGTNPCGNWHSHLAYSGEADMIVHAQYSIDNPVTGGPDTSQYNSSTTVVEILVQDYNLAVESSSKNIDGDCTQSESSNSNDGEVGFGCYFYGVDFANGGSYTSENQVLENTYGKCVMMITPAIETIDVRVDPSEIHLKYNLDQTDVLEQPKAKVTVTLTSAGLPMKNMAVLIKVCTLPGTIATDGHIGHDSRTPGWMKSWSEPCDQGTRPFAKLVGQNGISGIVIVARTDGNGEILLDYIPPKYKRYQYIAGSDEITATALHDAPALQDTANVITKVPDLLRMPGSVDDSNCRGQSSANYTFAAQSGSKHGCIFYGTAYTVQALQRIADEFMQRQQDCMNIPGSGACQVSYAGSSYNVVIKSSPQPMRINAMSLAWGGLTDNVRGINWQPPHQSHNDGRQVDLSFGIFQHLGISKNNPLCNNLGSMCKNYDIDRIMLLRDVVQDSSNFSRFPSNEGGNLKTTFADPAPHIHIFFIT
jgi:hypothetical protein